MVVVSVVSVVPFSDDPSSNPADLYNFIGTICV